MSGEFDSVEEVDQTIEELVELLEQGPTDIAVATEAIHEATVEADDDADPDDVAENVALPFYEEDREMAFTIGLTVGALLEAREYVGDDDEDEQTETAVTAEQSQSVSVST